MPSERDLIRVIVEIIVELREGEDDTENADDPQASVGSYCSPFYHKIKSDHFFFQFDDNQSDISQATIKKDKFSRKTKERDEMSAEERKEADLTDIRCLWLCIAVLERVNGVSIPLKTMLYSPIEYDNVSTVV